ncbi:MAG: molybdopterin-dependent oxidoreductase [Thermodesulfobacteriota bacterium]|nr:molybdopterin-dependent oxidoreductase [Thermodesulfobacteriota bacterium]
MTYKTDEIWEDKWVNTTCGVCYCGCSARVRVVNGVPVKIEGIKESTMGGTGAGLCGKGVAGLMYYHDPYRLTKPLRRTNPEKGIGVDPMWKEISWDEALDEIATRMKKIMDDDPNKIMFTNQTMRASDGPHNHPYIYAKAFGVTDNGNFIIGGGSLHCGNAAHMLGGLIHGAWSIAPDWRYTKYVLKWGSSKGTGSGHSAMTNARLRADAVRGGIKEVVFDPMGNFAGGKATQWVPILPGTDTAVGLAMANYILNTLKVFDSLYIKAKTNLVYLIREDGTFIRDEETEKPCVYDEKAKKIKLFDDSSIAHEDFALEGEYEHNGEKVKPCFTALKEHLKKFSPQWASEISTVPVGTIVQIAKDWVDHAQIGSTITIEGKSFPYRPVASVTFRGAQGHSNGIHQVAAIDLLSQLVGAEDVPGGTMGWPSMRRKYPGGQYERMPKVGPDGVLIPAVFYSHMPWPPHTPSVPCKNAGCVDFWTHSTLSHIPYVKERDIIHEKFGMKAKPEMVFGISANFIISQSDWGAAVDYFKDMFVVQMDIWSNETDEAVGDIILPDVSYLEKECWSSEIDAFFFSGSPSYEDWYVHLQKAVAKPLGECRFFMDVYLDVAERVGVLDKFNEILNNYYSVEDEELRIKPGEKLTWAEIGDRYLKWIYGDDKEKIEKQGYATWHKPIEDVYWRWEVPSRCPVYMEFLIGDRRAVEQIMDDVDFGLELDTAQYTPLPDWFWPTSHKELDKEFDLLAFSYRDILHTNNSTFQNPYIDEASELCPYTFTITMNTELAKQKDMKDGDVIWMENKYNVREKGVIKTMEAQHPKVIGISGQGGLWAKGRPVAKGKGSNFCKLLPSYLRHYDPITGNIETSVAVKVYKA